MRLPGCRQIAMKMKMKMLRLARVDGRGEEAVEASDHSVTRPIGCRCVAMTFGSDRPASIRI